MPLIFFYIFDVDDYAIDNNFNILPLVSMPSRPDTFLKQITLKRCIHNLNRSLDRKKFTFVQKLVGILLTKPLSIKALIRDHKLFTISIQLNFIKYFNYC